MQQNTFPFVEYATTFMDIQIYIEQQLFLYNEKIWVRKINFCFVNNVECINKYFNQRYFDCYDLL